MKILFVDDDVGILEAAKTALEIYGYEVITAKSGKECLDRISNVDIVFLDIKMPGMNGIEVLREIKKRDKDLPVVMITAYATVDTAIQAMKEGAIDYIRKPFNIDELQGSILAAIEDIKFRKIKDFYSGDAMQKFKEMGGKGIYISRQKKDLDAIFIPIEKDLEIRNMEEIKKDIDKNIKNDMVILLLDIEYIYKNYKEKTREFLEWLNKKATSLNCKIIMSAKISLLDDKSKKELQDMMADIHLGILTDSISNYIRRKVINLLSDGEKYSFTKIAQEIKIEDNPKLSFHLKKLKDDGVIMQDDEKRYYLTPLGKEIAKFIEGIKKDKMKGKGNILWLID